MRLFGTLAHTISFSVRMYIGWFEDSTAVIVHSYEVVSTPSRWSDSSGLG